jgi:CheY-like chemotaxis protein
MDEKIDSIAVKKHFGASVRAWRKSLGISQEELASRAALHRTYVCDVERGARNVSLESIEKLARALGIAASTLFAYEILPTGARANQRPSTNLVQILYVEDMPEDVEMAMRALHEAGIANRIRVARDGAEALELLLPGRAATPPAPPGENAPKPEPFRPEVILLDLSLPKVDGLEVLRRVKSHPETSPIPVVVLTASTREADWHTSKRLGATAYITKPLNFESLTRVTPRLSLQWALLQPTV